MNTRQLEAFQAVMQTGSMSDAARLISVTQPAVSRLIKDLESTLAFKLFLRENGRLFPTPGAQRFFDEVQRHFVGIDRLRQTVDEIRAMKAGSFRLAAMPALANSVLADVIVRFSRSEPELSISFDCMESNEIASQVAGQQYDLGIVALPFIGDELQYGPCFAADCRLITPANHPFRHLDRVQIDDLAHQSLIPAGQSHELSRRKLNALLDDQLIKPNQPMDTGHFHTAAQLVEQQVGVALVDPFTAEHFAQHKGISRPFSPAIEFYFGFVMPGSRKVSPLLQRFMDHLEAQLMRTIPLRPVEPQQINHRS